MKRIVPEGGGLVGAATDGNAHPKTSNEINEIRIPRRMLGFYHTDAPLVLDMLPCLREILLDKLSGQCSDGTFPVKFTRHL